MVKPAYFTVFFQTLSEKLQKNLLNIYISLIKIIKSYGKDYIRSQRRLHP